MSMQTVYLRDDEAARTVRHLDTLLGSAPQYVVDEARVEARAAALAAYRHRQSLEDPVAIAAGERAHEKSRARELAEHEAALAEGRCGRYVAGVWTPIPPANRP
jgi:hypothetical protein